jgi:hypothetical protein
VNTATVTQTEVPAEAARSDRKRRRLCRTLYYGGLALVLADSLLWRRRPAIGGSVADLWLAYAGAGLVVAGLLVSAIDIGSFFRRWRLHATGRCPHCGYDLRGSPARCPECGLEQRLVRTFGQYAEEE